jgi:hypothetical protein
LHKDAEIECQLAGKSLKLVCHDLTSFLDGARNPELRFVRYMTLTGSALITSTKIDSQAVSPWYPRSSSVDQRW